MKRFLLPLMLAFLALPNAASAQYVMDIGSLIGGIRVGDFSGELDNLDRAQTVYVTRLTQIAGVRISGPTLDRALASRQRVLAYLRYIIGQNRAAMKALAVHHESLEDVIFLTTTSDGTAMLYVDDR